VDPAVPVFAVRCGRCGGPLWGRIHSTGRRRYACVKAPGLPGCGWVTIDAEPAEDEIRDQGQGLPASFPWSRGDADLDDGA